MSGIKLKFSAAAVKLSSSSQFQGEDPESMAELPEDKGKGKESKAELPEDKDKDKESKKEKRQRERAELIAAMQQTVGEWEKKLHDLTIAGNAQVDELRAQLTAKDVESSRVQLTMVTFAESLQDLVATKDQEIFSLKSQLDTERLGHQEVMRGADQEIFSLKSQLDTERLSHQEVMRGAAERANSTDGQLRSMLAELQSTNQELRQDLSHQKAANEALHQSLTECQASTAKQPPIEQDGDLAKVSEEKRRLEERVAGLREELEASEAKLGRQEIAFQEAEETIRPLQCRVKQLADDNSGLSRAKRLLETSLMESNSKRNIMLSEAKALKKSTRRMEVEVVRMGKVMDKAQAEADELHVRNKVLETEMILHRQPRILIAKLDRCQKELDRRQKEADRLTTEFGRGKKRLAEWAAKINKDAEEAVTGEGEMNALLGVPEKANEGLLRPQFPFWMGLDFWFLVGLFLMGLFLVVAYSPDSATYVGEQMGRGRVCSMRCRRPEWDPYLDLSRGMYGV